MPLQRADPPFKLGSWHHPVYNPPHLGVCNISQPWQCPWSSCGCKRPRAGSIKTIRSRILISGHHRHIWWSRAWLRLRPLCETTSTLGRQPGRWDGGRLPAVAALGGGWGPARPGFCHSFFRSECGRCDCGRPGCSSPVPLSAKQVRTQHPRNPCSSPICRSPC